MNETDDPETKLLALMSLRGRLDDDEYAAASRALLGGEGDDADDSSPVTESELRDVLGD